MILQFTDREIIEMFENPFENSLGYSEECKYGKINNGGGNEEMAIQLNVLNLKKKNF